MAVETSQSSMTSLHIHLWMQGDQRHAPSEILAGRNWNALPGRIHLLDEVLCLLQVALCQVTPVGSSAVLAGTRPLALLPPPAAVAAPLPQQVISCLHVADWMACSTWSAIMICQSLACKHLAGPTTSRCQQACALGLCRHTSCTQLHSSLNARALQASVLPLLRAAPLTPAVDPAASAAALIDQISEDLQPSVMAYATAIQRVSSSREVQADIVHAVGETLLQQVS